MKTQVSDDRITATECIRAQLGTVIAIYQTGSSVICDPPVRNTDVDYVLLVPDRDQFWADALSVGYDQTSKDEYEGLCADFTCYRRGMLNLIVTDDVHFYRQFCLATAAAKQFKLNDKHDRITLFQGVIYNNWQVVL